MTYELPGYDQWKEAAPDLADDSEEYEPGWSDEDYAADAAERELDWR